jgi:hypothetical protein
MTGSGNAGKRQRAFQLDLLKADLNIGFVLVRSAQASYCIGEDRHAWRNLEAARDAFLDAARLFSGLGGADAGQLEPALGELRTEIENTERLARRGGLRITMVYN